MLRLLCWLSCCALLASCGGGGESEAVAVPVESPAPPQDAPCSDVTQRQTLRAYMQEHYYWQAQSGDDGAASQDAYFQSLLARPADRYSFTQPEAAHDLQFILGRRIGYGYTVIWADAAQTTMKIRNIEPRSPAARAGLRRGDTVLAIDGNSPARVAAGFPGAVAAPGLARDFHVRDTAGQERRLTVFSEDFPLSAVPATATFVVRRDSETGPQPVKVGYLAYQQFATYGFIDLGDAVRSLTAQGVSELVLDLRYNGGGSVTMARDLASMVGGTRVTGQVFTELRFNSRQARSNLSLPFISIPGGLPAPPMPGLSRVLVIASRGTASASELVVNGLRPFMPVVLVGETTYGKPYGFVPRQSCGTTYNAVNFESFNARGQGGFTAGFAPDCAAPDDLDRQLGDPLEKRTQAALFYIAHGRCEAAAPQSASTAAPSPVFGETSPSRMFLR